MATAAQPPLQWSCENSHLHSARCGHTATTIPATKTQSSDHVVALAFGDSSKQHYTSRKFFGSVLLYNATTGVSPEVIKAPMDVVPGRSHHAAAALGNNVLFVGGRGPSGDYFDSGPSSCCMLLMLEKPRKWKVLRCPAEDLARRGHSLTALDGKYYIYGGERRGIHLDDIWKFHPKTLSWEKQSTNNHNSPIARAFHASSPVLIEGRNYLGIFGGQTLDGPKQSQFDIYTLDYRCGEWGKHSLVRGESADALPLLPSHFGHTISAMGY